MSLEICSNGHYYDNSLNNCPYCDSVTNNYLENGYILNNEYRIIGKIGEGGFYITYLAEELTLNYKVTIKEFMPRSLVARSQMNNSISPNRNRVDTFNYLRKNFEEEAKIFISLRHLNIIECYKLIKANNTVYMIMDYEEGETLESYLEKYPKLNENEIINIMNPIFEAIKYVRLRGILHINIAPDSIYILENGIPIIIDFSSAEYINIIRKYSLILSSIGKYGYAPPEQYGNSKLYLPTDIYALGAVLYRMMSGKRPVSSLERQNSVYSDGKDPLENLNRICKNKYSKNLIDVVNKAMNLKREDRFQTIDEMQKALFSKSTWINIKGIRF